MAMAGRGEEVKSVTISAYDAVINWWRGHLRLIVLVASDLLLTILGNSRCVFSIEI